MAFHLQLMVTLLCMHKSQSESEWGAQVLSLGCTQNHFRYFKVPHVRAIPQASEIRISGGGSQASLYVESSSGILICSPVQDPLV